MDESNSTDRVRHVRRRVVATGIALAAGVALSLGFFVRRTLHSGTGGSADALLAIALPDSEGKEQSLGQWRGRVVVVNFWATWCAPCREEMPRFVAAQRELGAKGLQFVGIAIDDAAKVREFMKEIGLNYPSLIGGYGAMELSKTLGNRLMALPFTVIVDRQGRIVHTQLGPLEDSALRRVVTAAL